MSQNHEEEPSDLFVASETTKAKRQFSRRANKISTAYENLLSVCQKTRWLHVVVGGLPELGLAAETDMYVGMEDFIFESGGMFSDATSWLSGYPASQSLAHELLFPMLTAMVPRTWLDLPHALREKLMTDSRNWLLLRSATQTEESWKIVRQWKRRLIAAHEAHTHSLGVLMNEHLNELQRLIQQAVMGTAALVSVYLQCGSTRYSGLEIPEALQKALPVSVIGHSTTPETLSIPYEFAEVCVQRQLLLNHKSTVRGRKELGREESAKRFVETLPEVDLRNIPSVTEFVQTVVHELNHIIAQLENQFSAYKHLSNRIESDIVKSDKPETNFTQIRAWAQYVLNTTAIPHDAKMLKQTSLLFGRIINSISATLNITVTGKHLVKCSIISSDPALGKRTPADKPRPAKISLEEEIRLCKKKIDNVIEKVPVWKRKVEQLELLLASQTNNNNNINSSLENAGNRSSNEIDDLDPVSPLVQPTPARVAAPSRPRDASPKRPAPPPPLSTVPVPKQPSRAILPTLPKKRPVHIAKGAPLLAHRRPQLQSTDQSSDHDSNNSLEDEHPVTAERVLSQPSRQQARVTSPQADAHDNISDF